MAGRCPATEQKRRPHVHSPFSRVAVTARTTSRRPTDTQPDARLRSQGGKTRRLPTRLFLLALCLAWSGPPAASAKEKLSQRATVHALRAWYAGVSAMEYDAPLEHTAPPLTVELDAKTRLIVPAHLAEQRIIDIQRCDLGAGMEKSVVVGLDARTTDGLKQAYALVYTRKDGAMALVAELPLRERFERIEQARVNRDEPVLVLNGSSGMHFMDLFVYRFVGGRPELLHANGSAAGAELRYDITTPTPSIWIAVEDWSDPHWNFAASERRWNVYTWAGREFIYNERLSSARELSVEERISQYTMRILQRADEFKQDDALPARPRQAGLDPGRR